MQDPKLILCIDNCFACKRWVKPMDWMRLIRSMGVTWVEQSADTECDPLYMDARYTKDWIELVRQGGEKTGVGVKNVYSGHGTYATCGLAHWDARVRARFRDQWMKPQADTARALNAGFGFFAHAFEHGVLQSAGTYEKTLQTLYGDLAELAGYAREIGLPAVGLEQMYTPHMPPWTIAGTRELLSQIYARAGAPMYVTLDVGHMNGQQFFQRPGEEDIREALASARHGGQPRRLWIGSEAANCIFRDAAAGKEEISAATERILENIDENPHLFAAPEDGEIWTWIEKLGKYSPIVHLQQSDGKSSPHWPFSEAYNRRGVVTGERLLFSLQAAFSSPAENGMPDAVGEIALTLEPFVGTAANPYDAMEDIAQSVAYWRKFIPRDGMRLSEAAALQKSRMECK